MQLDMERGECLVMTMKSRLRADQERSKIIHTNIANGKVGFGNEVLIYQCFYQLPTLLLKRLQAYRLTFCV